VSAPDHLPALATPAEVAEYLHTTPASLAQDRYRGVGPKFIKRGRRVLYRWSDVVERLDPAHCSASTIRDSSDE
jgi:hypothetical protein